MRGFKRRRERVPSKRYGIPRKLWKKCIRAEFPGVCGKCGKAIKGDYLFSGIRKPRTRGF